MFSKLAILALVMLASSCQCQPRAGVSSNTPATPQDLVSRGRSIYITNCISCHNSNPRQVGALGPDVAGSSLELLRAKVIKGTYPADYKPKRMTSQMAPLPHLEKELEAMHAFLNQ